MSCFRKIILEWALLDRPPAPSGLDDPGREPEAASARVGVETPLRLVREARDMADE